MGYHKSKGKKQACPVEVIVLEALINSFNKNILMMLKKKPLSGSIEN